MSHDEHIQPTLLEEDSYESLQNENSNISEHDIGESNISDNSDIVDSDTSIYELMSRRGFFYIAHSTFQLNSALRESPNVRKEKDRIVVLEFVARWCGLCRFIEPQLEVFFKALQWGIQISDSYNQTSQISNGIQIPNYLSRFWGALKQGHVRAVPSRHST